ncbi:hypothetical protein EV702DRAFT_1049262 [Suillus placidus]|uniref:Uncharacterized protein n=1 Tax=Suillus placidus TaxID=48579 RepID=A0A9P6ZMZ5_9AGAM|nr:hypothetical protein EV702DRAFT_1049262 [Suillus placidus]
MPHLLPLLTLLVEPLHPPFCSMLIHGASADGSSSHQPGAGAPSESLKSNMHNNCVLEAKFAAQLETAQHQWGSQLQEAQQTWITEFENNGTGEDGMDWELKKDVERMEKSAAACRDNGLKVVMHMVFQTLMGVGKLWNQPMNDGVTTITYIFWEPSNMTGPFYSVDDLLKPSFRRVDASDTRKHVSTRISLA